MRRGKSIGVYEGWVDELVEMEQLRIIAVVVQLEKVALEPKAFVAFIFSACQPVPPRDSSNLPTYDCESFIIAAYQPFFTLFTSCFFVVCSAFILNLSILLNNTDTTPSSLPTPQPPCRCTARREMSTWASKRRSCRSTSKRPPASTRLLPSGNTCGHALSTHGTTSRRSRSGPA